MIKALIVLNGPHGSMEFEVGQKAASHPERKGVTSIEADIDTGRYVVNFGSKEHWEIKTQNAIVKTELLF